MGVINKFLLLNIFLVTVSSQSCYFDFEDDSELQNFILTCNGIVGDWVIKKRNSLGTPLPDAGDRILTVAKYQTYTCLQSKNTVQVNENQQLTVDFFRYKPGDSDSYQLMIYLKCDKNEDHLWDVLTGNEKPNKGDWGSETHTFPTSKTSCKLEMHLFIGGNTAQVEIDRIVFNDLPSPDECYVVPKTTPSTTETTTTEVTVTSTTETSPEPTTTTEVTVTSTTETSPEPTTTTEVTVTSTTETSPEPTTTTEVTVTSTTETSTESTTTDTTPTITDTTTGTTTVPNSVQPTVTTQTTTDPTISTTVPTTNSIPPETTTPEDPTMFPPQQDYPNFSMFYFVVIIATSGIFVFLSLGVCWFVLRKSRARKNHHLS